MSLERGIVHRGLVPADIELTPGGKAKLCDLGENEARPAAHLALPPNVFDELKRRTGKSTTAGRRDG